MRLVVLAMLIQCVLVFCFLGALGTAQEHVIVVSSTDGNDTDECLNSNGSIPCQTLNFTMLRFHENPKNSTLVQVESGRYNYSLNVTFSWLQDFTIQIKPHDSPSSRTGEVVINCTEEAGFSFQSCTQIRFSGIRFQGCGASHFSTTGDGYKPHYNHTNLSAAIFFVNSEDVFIENCEIRNSSGIGVNLYDVGGTVNITRTVFDQNGPLSCPSAKCIQPGGGVYIEFTRTGGIPPWKRNNYRHSVNNSFYLFHSCNFTNNRSPQMRFEDDIESPGFRHNPFGRGGAVSLFLFGSARGNSFLFKHCKFVNNSAVYGAGVFVEYHDVSQNNNVTISDGSFENNVADLAGGAVRSGNVNKQDKFFLLQNKVIQQGCNYTANTAIFGGAVSHYGRKYKPFSQNDLHEMVFSNCTWIENKGTVGSAIGLNLDHVTEGKVQPFSPIYVLFENCNVIRNAIVLTEDHTVIGQGSVYSHSIPVIFRGKVRLEDNTNMSALVLDNTLLYVHDKCTFRNNTGHFGGAIALYGESQIVTMNGSVITFDSNKALVKGGALYVQTPGPPLAAFKTRKLTMHECFLAYEDLGIEDVDKWNTNISFTHNFAHGSGDSIYATTLKSCFKRLDTRRNNSALNWTVIQYHPEDQQHIGTDPVFIRIVRSHWNVAPSEQFNATVHLINERNKACDGTILIVVKNNQRDVKLNEPSPLFLIPQSGKISNLQLKGIPKRLFTISFTTVQGQLIEHTVDSMLKDCHPGYVQPSSDNKSCICLLDRFKGEYAGISHCGIHNRDVYIKPGFWFGKVSEKSNVYTTYKCPAKYCNNTILPKSGLPKPFLYREEHMCTGHRIGTLCGKCKNGTNLLLGNEDCSIVCHPVHSLKLLAIAVGSIFLILFLLLFDLSIFIKYLSCWLFSYQVMEFLKYDGEILDPFISGVIDVANWRVPSITGMCIARGMDNLQKLGFNYLLPLYIIIVLVVFGFIASKRPQCYFNRDGARILPFCCVLLILCYTNVLTISFQIFHWIDLHADADDWVLFVDGSITSKSCTSNYWCIILSLLAAVWLLLLLPLPIILSLKPEWIRDYRTIRNLCSVFQDCFQEGKEWFASIYFFLRILFITLAMFIPGGAYTPIKRTVLDVSTVAVLVMFVHFKPYNDRYSKLNMLDAALLGNICIFSLLCSNRGNVSTNHVQDILWYLIDVLAYVPLVYFIGILIYLSYVKRANLVNYLTTFRLKLKDIFCKCDGENLLEQEVTVTEGTSDFN